FFFFSSRRRHTRSYGDWSSDVCSSDLPDALTPGEFERVKIHPRVGAEILRNVPFGAPIGELVLCHHERWDGLGYPAGLRGEDIRSEERRVGKEWRSGGEAARDERRERS